MESFWKYFKCIEGSIGLRTQTVTAEVPMAHTLPAQPRPTVRMGWEVKGPPDSWWEALPSPTEKIFPSLPVNASLQSSVLVLATKL